MAKSRNVEARESVEGELALEQLAGSIRDEVALRLNEQEGVHKLSNAGLLWLAQIVHYTRQAVG